MENWPPSSYRPQSIVLNFFRLQQIGQFPVVRIYRIRFGGPRELDLRDTEFKRSLLFNSEVIPTIKSRVLVDTHQKNGAMVCVIGGPHGEEQAANLNGKRIERKGFKGDTETWVLEWLEDGASPLTSDDWNQGRKCECLILFLGLLIKEMFDQIQYRQVGRSGARYTQGKLRPLEGADGNYGGRGGRGGGRGGFQRSGGRGPSSREQLLSCILKSIICNTRGYFLALDVSYSLVPGGTVQDIVDDLGYRSSMGEDDRRNATDTLRKRCIVAITSYAPRNAYKIFGILDIRPTDIEEFRVRGQEQKMKISFIEYLCRTYPQSIDEFKNSKVTNSAMLECRSCKAGSRPAKIPAALLRPVTLNPNKEEQETIIKVNKMRADERMRQITAAIQDITDSTRGGSVLSEMGVTLHSNADTVDGYLMPLPNVKVGDNPIHLDDKGAFLKGFVQCRTIHAFPKIGNEYILIVPRECSRDAERTFSESLSDVMRDWRLDLREVESRNVVVWNSDDAAELEQKFRRLGDLKNYKMAFCVFSGNNRRGYDEFKRLMMKLDIPSQCCQLQTIKKHRRSMMTAMLSSASAKIFKSHPWELEHPPLEQLKFTCAVGMGTYQPQAWVQQFMCTVGLSATTGKEACDLVSEFGVCKTSTDRLVSVLTEPFTGLLKRLKDTSKNKRLPKRFIIFRSGVNEGVLDLVEETETAVMREAYEAFGGSVENDGTVYILKHPDMRVDSGEWDIVLPMRGDGRAERKATVTLRDGKPVMVIPVQSGERLSRDRGIAVINSHDKKKRFFVEWKPSFTVVVVSKPSSCMRMFVEKGRTEEAPAGLVLEGIDSCENLDAFESFLLNPIPGTVPVIYRIIRNDAGEPEVTKEALQKLSFHLCALWYNRLGMQKYPHVLRHAEKLAQMPGDVGREKLVEFAEACKNSTVMMGSCAL